MWGLWPRCFGYRPQCWKTGTRMLSRYWKVLTFPLMFLLICRKAHRPRTRRGAFADRSVENKRDAVCVHDVYLVTKCLSAKKKKKKKNQQALTHRPSSSPSCSSSDKKKKKKKIRNKLHCTFIHFCMLMSRFQITVSLFRFLFWCQCFLLAILT